MDEPSTNVRGVDENDPLLRNHHGDKTANPDTDDTLGLDPNIVLPKRRWIVEPIVLFFCVSILSQSTVLSQYVYYRVGLQYNVSTGGNGSSRAFVCDPKSLLNSTEHQITSRIQNEASSWTLYRSIVQSVVALLVLPLYASTSDYLGRKPFLLLPTIGMMLDSAGLLVIVLFDLPLVGFVILGAVSSLGGGFGTLFASVFSYLADTTSRKWRPIRVALVEAMFGVAGTVMELLMGWWIKMMGYSIPLMFSASIAVVNFFYVVVLVPEVRLKRSAGGSLVSLPFTNIASLFTSSARLSVRLGLLLASLCIFCACFMGSSTLGSLYQMNYPFCLDSVFIGYLSAAKIVGFQIGATIGLVIFRKYLGVPTIGLIVMGLLSSTLGYLVTGLAQSVTMLFVTAVVSMFSMLAIPLFRAYMSQLSPADKQGALFSCVGVLELVGNLVGATAFTLLYKATLDWMPGFVYMVAAGVSTVALLLTSVAMGLDRCWPMNSCSLAVSRDADEGSSTDAPVGSINR
ncbi:hypothetical protein BOX15_Mlig010300g2 [Macrostomum lignano]|uniref:Major facilitator superfamily (MFS) profile domain-containing protein n=1 Tax=Macrostomum lignano TaxID=282301 RepID=A0A267GZY1_9PLAT|nr:hypothetical protein BOX15_Mlig010300g2 [Macrostomum lignano]